jgi:hypothetical protein
MTATETGPLTAAELDLIDAWWRAANYLSVGQIYLLANPLLGEGLRPEDVKPRLLGHWGTTPGLNLSCSTPPARGSAPSSSLPAKTSRSPPRSARSWHSAVRGPP